jgi:hypothetical protein
MSDRPIPNSVREAGSAKFEWNMLTRTSSSAGAQQHPAMLPVVNGWAKAKAPAKTRTKNVKTVLTFICAPK